MPAAHICTILLLCCTFPSRRQDKNHTILALLFIVFMKCHLLGKLIWKGKTHTHTLSAKPSSADQFRGSIWTGKSMGKVLDEYKKKCGKTYFQVIFYKLCDFLFPQALLPGFVCISGSSGDGRLELTM